jgi:hypothetical protein
MVWRPDDVAHATGPVSLSAAEPAGGGHQSRSDSGPPHQSMKGTSARMHGWIEMRQSNLAVP